MLVKRWSTIRMECLLTTPARTQSTHTPLEELCEARKRRERVRERDREKEREREIERC